MLEHFGNWHYIQAKYWLTFMSIMRYFKSRLGLTVRSKAMFELRTLLHIREHIGKTLLPNLQVLSKFSALKLLNYEKILAN